MWCHRCPGTDSDRPMPGPSSGPDRYSVQANGIHPASCDTSGGLRGRPPFPWVYRYAMPLQNWSFCSILSCKEQQRGYVLLRCRYDTLVTPHLSPCGRSPVRSDLEFALTELTTAPSTRLVMAMILRTPKNTTTTNAFILGHYQAGG